MFFEILGIDIMIDQNLKPWLIEVNNLPSFGTDSKLDKQVKGDLVSDTLKLINLNQKRKKRIKKEKAEQFNRRMHRDTMLTKD